MDNQQTELSQEIADLQKEKLRQEIKELKRPLIFRSQFLLAIIAIASLFTQGTLSNIRRERAELRIEEANKKLSSIQLVKDSTLKELDSLNEEIVELNLAKRNLTERTENLINAISKAPQSKLNPTIKVAVSSAQNSFYSIVLYGYNVDQSSFNLSKNWLINDGYSLTKAQLLAGKRRDWLALRPTVLYYDSQAENTARTIAEKLGQITGRSFTWQKGAGFGIPKDGAQKSLRIHFVE